MLLGALRHVHRSCNCVGCSRYDPIDDPTVDPAPTPADQPSPLKPIDDTPVEAVEAAEPPKQEPTPPKGSIPIRLEPVPTLDEARKKAQEQYGLYQVVLAGDAAALAYSDTTTTSFGGGLDFSTLQWNFSFMLRIGSDSGELSDTKAIGRFILTPENFGNPSLDVRTQWFPWTTGETFAGITPRSGFQVYYRGSEIDWVIPIDGVEDSPNIRGNVNAFGMGYVARFIPISTTSNHIEIQGASNLALRIIGGDVALAQAVDGEQRALDIALNDRKRVYWGWEVLSTMLRVRSLRAGFNLSYFPGTTPGLSNFQYTVSLALHDGPVLSTINPGAK